MQTLRKKTSPLKYKNETTRFLGDGVSFKAKLIGILEVSEARGDRMCQEALSDLKMAIRAAGEHKQRITINIAIDGLRLRDEKTGDSLYHHPVHKISFIAQDMTDSRAFGYIFGSPDTGHRFFGIKTDKAASQVVIAMRDLFQVVFALKKKEIELAKQHLDKTRFTNPSLFSDSTISNIKPIQETLKNVSSDNKGNSNSEIKSEGTAVADLVDLELELNSLQQGLNQMERITPSDPFGDSFINYTKPILPPPPSSGRERSNRSSEVNNLFSPRSPRNAGQLDSSNDVSRVNSREEKSSNFSRDLSTSLQQPTNEDWFTESKTKSLFEDPPLVPEPTKDEKHEMTKQDILSQFDVFTELDPLGTGKIKPYVDKKHFFQELKNPPKKVLNDLVSQSQQDTNLSNKKLEHTKDFTTDPFGEDPFVTEDPFAETDFIRHDPFEAEFATFKTELSKSNEIKSPKESLSKEITRISSNSPKSVHFEKQNAVDIQFEKFQPRQDNKLMKLHENFSVELSSESEAAPEPPPRPETTLMQIKPPPLPPKKQGNEICVKQPLKQLSTQESPYDFMDVYETGPSALGVIKNLNKSPPLPPPARKSKYRTESELVPETQKRQLNVQSSDEDYLTPISLVYQKTEPKSANKNASSILLPPPQKSVRKSIPAQSSVASSDDPKSIVQSDNVSSLEGLDITLSELTLSGLNDLATKLNIPPNQLSNMTLVQLTNYLTNFIKLKSNGGEIPPNLDQETNSNSALPTFDADFSSNFNTLNSNITISKSDSYDRYAVFRELMKEELKQTKIDTEPEEIKEQEENLPNCLDSNVNLYSSMDNDLAKDKYAALREIVDSELKTNDTGRDDNKNETERNILNEEVSEIEDSKTDTVYLENKFIEDKKETSFSTNLNDYNTSLSDKNVAADNESVKSPKSPCSKIIKSPVPVAVTNVVRTNVPLNSGSLSDVISGSSPEIDNTGSNVDMDKKIEDAAGESWAIFDQEIPIQSVKETKNIHSEEGISPWSSDSKEFGNGSPLEWQRGDSESGGDQWTRRRMHKDQEDWWDTSAEPEVQYYQSNRRSTDSYEDDNYECYEKPRRRKQTNYVHCGQPTGGHSSSSRDVSPWEEEPRRELRPGWVKHAKQHSLEKYRERRHTDSWDEEDDYEYEENVHRFYHPDRQKWEMDRERFDKNSRTHSLDKWDDEWSSERRHKRRRDGERWCCPDWGVGDHEKPGSKYGSVRWPHADGQQQGAWRDRKHDEMYYRRESQESPWEDEYSNEAEEVSSSRYIAAKRSWKRPSSASEMDRNIETRSRYYLAAGGSDGERERRCKAGRRSRSRDSQYSETMYRHKSEVCPVTRGPHRSRQYSKQQFEIDFKQIDNSKLDHTNKKNITSSRKKTKDSPKSEINTIGTFPRKSQSRSKLLFENDFVPTEIDTPKIRTEKRFSYENEFETSDPESPTTFNQSLKSVKHNNDNMSQKSVKEPKLSSKFQNKPQSLFEDDFSLNEKSEQFSQENSISNIREEADTTCTESSKVNNLESATNFRKRKINKHRLSNNIQSDINIKKSESVNIFSRESDPFDDDFFSEDVSTSNSIQRLTERSSKSTDLKWSEDFEESPLEKSN